MKTEIISGIFLVIVALIEALATRDRKKVKHYNEKAEERASQRAEESKLSMQMMSATVKLALVEAEAMTHGHLNGNVEEAKAAALKAQSDYEAFLVRIASKELAKH